MRYIDADALVQNLRETFDSTQAVHSDFYAGLFMAVKIAADAPTADVVEASEYKRLCNKLSREERRVRKLRKRIAELEQKGTQE